MTLFKAKREKFQNKYDKNTQNSESLPPSEKKFHIISDRVLIVFLKSKLRVVGSHLRVPNFRLT